MLEKVYFANGNDFILYNEAIIVTIRSGVGFTWIGKAKHYDTTDHNTSALVADSGIYKTTQASLNTILDIVNLTERDAQGQPILYEKVLSLVACQGKQGTFFKIASMCTTTLMPKAIHWRVCL